MKCMIKKTHTHTNKKTGVSVFRVQIPTLQMLCITEAITDQHHHHRWFLLRSFQSSILTCTPSANSFFPRWRSFPLPACGWDVSPCPAMPSVRGRLSLCFAAGQDQPPPSPRRNHRPYRKMGRGFCYVNPVTLTLFTEDIFFIII